MNRFGSVTAPEKQIPRRGLPERTSWNVIVSCWLLLALAYTPAVVLTSPPAQARGLAAFFEAFVFLIGSYLPWALGTPALLHLSKCWIVDTGRRARHLVLLAGGGVLAIPLLTALGWLAGHALVRMTGGAESVLFDLRANQSALVATALFAIPLYLAVMGIGQLLGHAALRRGRERELAGLNEEALRSRLQQHFLFNALNAIGELGYRDAALADRALGHVARLLRALLERPPEVSLREEIGTAAEFMQLHQVLATAPAMHIEVEPAAWNASVPSMVLQPLLENAIQHGAPSGHGRGILISAAVSDATLVLSVENSVQDERAGGLGIGLDNLRRRLALLYGPPATLTTQREGQRFTATVRMPWVKAALP